MPITPCLWFDHNAVEAAAFYVDVVPNSRIISQVPAGGDNPSTKAGETLVVEVDLDGQRLTLLNGGPQFPHTQAFSLQVPCATQAESDAIFDALIAGGGAASQCGWLTDRFGLSWQVFPAAMGEYLNGPDPDGAARAMAAMLQMVRIDLEGLRLAYESP
jgi:predicted 3-demethylubiquinone-9 3-methyltransferase (glyoxalase superfamily)